MQIPDSSLWTVLITPLCLCVMCALLSPVSLLLCFTPATIAMCPESDGSCHRVAGLAMLAL